MSSRIVVPAWATGAELARAMIQQAVVDATDPEDISTFNRLIQAQKTVQYVEEARVWLLGPQSDWWFELAGLDKEELITGLRERGVL